MKDSVIAKLRELKLPVTKQNYALFGYWKDYRDLTPEEKLEVCLAVKGVN